MFLEWLKCYFLTDFCNSHNINYCCHSNVSSKYIFMIHRFSLHTKNCVLSFTNLLILKPYDGMRTSILNHPLAIVKFTKNKLIQLKIGSTFWWFIHNTVDLITSKKKSINHSTLFFNFFRFFSTLLG